jgi:hypothetical protein
MWPYLQMWFPLYTAALGAAIYFSVVPLIMSLKASSVGWQWPQNETFNRH